MRKALVAPVACVAGLLVAAVGRGVASLLHGVTPVDPATLVTVPLIVIAAGLIASLVAAGRVVRADPAHALHAE